jgi:hypothetical protein
MKSQWPIPIIPPFYPPPSKPCQLAGADDRLGCGQVAWAKFPRCGTGRAHWYRHILASKRGAAEKFERQRRFRTQPRPAGRRNYKVRGAQPACAERAWDETLKGFPNGEPETHPFRQPLGAARLYACSFTRRALRDAGLCSATPFGVSTCWRTCVGTNGPCQCWIETTGPRRESPARHG